MKNEFIPAPHRCSYACQGLLFFILEIRQSPAFAEVGHDRDGPLGVEGRLLSGHWIQQAGVGSRGGRQIDRKPAAGVRQPISGPDRPGKLASAAVAQVAVDLAGDVPLQAAEGGMAHGR